MNPEALILRRCYPVPVTFADLRAAADLFLDDYKPPTRMIQGAANRIIHTAWTQALKQVTGALDEVYAVVDGREVRVATMDGGNFNLLTDDGWRMRRALESLQEVADEQGYWECPHEARLNLSPRQVSHGEVARAVLVGQEALERGGVVRT